MPGECTRKKRCGQADFSTPLINTTRAFHHHIIRMVEFNTNGLVGIQMDRSLELTLEFHLANNVRYLDPVKNTGYERTNILTLIYTFTFATSTQMR